MFIIDKKQKVALVTGATGFIGKHLCKRLMLDGWDVHAIVRPSSDISILERFMAVPGYIHYHCYDGKSDAIVNCISEVRPTVVFHLASLFLSQHSFKDIYPLIESNIIFSSHLVEAMVQNEIYNLVNIGTSWQHYHNEDYNPVCLYAATKQAFENILKFYQETSPLKVITLKLFDTYGPDDDRPKLFNLLQHIAMNNTVLDMSPGEQLLDIVYIDDVEDSLLLAAKRLCADACKKNEVFAVSSGKHYSLKEVVEIFEEVTKLKLKINWGGRTYRDREVMTPWEKGMPLPGWSPKITLYDGIAKLVKN